MAQVSIFCLERHRCNQLCFNAPNKMILIIFDFVMLQLCSPTKHRAKCRDAGAFYLACLDKRSAGLVVCIA
jgi:hypothetical protein